LRDDPDDCIAKIPSDDTLCVTSHKALEVESNRTDTVLANGSFVVDHFSKEGAKTVIDLLVEGEYV
jgi:hypothetical protein